MRHGVLFEHVCQPHKGVHGMQARLLFAANSTLCIIIVVLEALLKAGAPQCAERLHGCAGKPVKGSHEVCVCLYLIIGIVAACRVVTLPDSQQVALHAVGQRVCEHHSGADGDECFQWAVGIGELSRGGHLHVVMCAQAPFLGGGHLHLDCKVHWQRGQLALLAYRLAADEALLQLHVHDRGLQPHDVMHGVVVALGLHIQHTTDARHHRQVAAFLGLQRLEFDIVL
mmetsp:Transcript_15811/g.42959  ORF Transcript_15811/g.42959 Transcript_15811/m.42959 type:complete len:227 (-) Transcript_15811:582-1262(-)